MMVTGGCAPNRVGWLKPFAGKLSWPWEARKHRQVTAAVHAHDAKICLQLLHAGRYAYHPLSVSASRLKSPINPFTPRALSARGVRSEEHTSELQSLMRISYAVFCLKKKKDNNTNSISHRQICRL